jgi:hypothetical protein
MTLIDGYQVTLTINSDNSRALTVAASYGKTLLTATLWDQASLLLLWNKTFRAGVATQLKALWASA